MGPLPAKIHKIESIGPFSWSKHQKYDFSHTKLAKIKMYKLDVDGFVMDS